MTGSKSYPAGWTRLGVRLARIALALVALAFAIPTVALALVVTDMCQDHEFWDRLGLSADGVGLGRLVGGVSGAGWGVLVGVVLSVLAGFIIPVWSYLSSPLVSPRGGVALMGGLWLVVVGGITGLSIDPASPVCSRTSVCMQVDVFRRLAWRSAFCHAAALALALFVSATGLDQASRQDGKAGRGLPQFRPRRRSSCSSSSGVGGQAASGDEAEGATPLLDGS